MLGSLYGVTQYNLLCKHPVFRKYTPKIFVRFYRKNLYACILRSKSDVLTATYKAKHHVNYQADEDLPAKMHGTKNVLKRKPCALMFRGADLVHVYHYTLAFKSSILLKQRSTLNSGCFSCRLSMMFLWSLEFCMQPLFAYFILR